MSLNLGRNASLLKQSQLQRTFFSLQLCVYVYVYRQLHWKKVFHGFSEWS